MKFTPFAAFGKVVILAQAAEGDARVVPIGENGLVKTGWYYYTNGCAKVHVLETGEQLDDRTPGWLNSEHAGASASSAGHLQLRFPVATEWLCIPHQYNKEGLPTLKSLICMPKEKITIKNNTNIFLVRGTLNIKGKPFTGPTQIRVRTGDVEATTSNNNPAYGVIFL
jgi:hypothetical protein